MKLRPDATMPPDHIAIYDWFRANGVDEWLPEKINVRIEGDRLTYTSFVWSGPRGWDFGNVSVDIANASANYGDRSVPLVAPMTADIRLLLETHGHALTERR